MSRGAVRRGPAGDLPALNQRGGLSEHLRVLAMNTLTSLPLLPGSLRPRLLRAFGVEIGEGADIRSRCTFTQPNVSIGRDVYINFGCTFEAAARITVEDGVSLAQGVMICTHTHEIGSHEHRTGPAKALPVHIGRGCWIGASVTIVPGATIGEGCIVAAGAVVAGELAPDGLYGGVPARRIRDLDPD